MKHEALSFNVPTSVAAGTALQCDRHQMKTVHVHGTFSATLQLQGKIAARAVVTQLGVPGQIAEPDDDAHDDWVNIGAAVTAAALIPVQDASGFELAVTHLRINVTAFVSGVPKAVFGGHDTRSDI